MNPLVNIIRTADQQELEKKLLENPELVNTVIHWGPNNKNQSHPLHFLCDAVFEKQISESTALSMAQVLFDAGANVDGALIEGKDTPLISACSLYTDHLGLLYLSKKPTLNHKGVHGGTCLHWAAYTGSSIMVAALIKVGMNLNSKDNQFGLAPIGWAIHAAQQTDSPRNQKDQLTCIKILTQAGADLAGVSVDVEKWPAIAEIIYP